MSWPCVSAINEAFNEVIGVGLPVSLRIIGRLGVDVISNAIIANQFFQGVENFGRIPSCCCRLVDELTERLVQQFFDFKGAVFVTDDVDGTRIMKASFRAAPQQPAPTKGSTAPIR